MDLWERFEEGLQRRSTDYWRSYLSSMEHEEDLPAAVRAELRSCSLSQLAELEPKRIDEAHAAVLQAMALGVRGWAVYYFLSAAWAARRPELVLALRGEDPAKWFESHDLHWRAVHTMVLFAAAEISVNRSDPLDVVHRINASYRSADASDDELLLPPVELVEALRGAGLNVALDSLFDGLDPSWAASCMPTERE